MTNKFETSVTPILDMDSKVGFPSTPKFGVLLQIQSFSQKNSKAYSKNLEYIVYGIDSAF